MALKDDAGAWYAIVWTMTRHLLNDAYYLSPNFHYKTLTCQRAFEILSLSAEQGRSATNWKRTKAEVRSELKEAVKEAGKNHTPLHFLFARTILLEFGLEYLTILENMEEVPCPA